jgi:uncharacterized tellurite resistance protein B-like protein
MARAHDLAFVKVLAAVAWADGTVTEEERNRVKVLLNGFGLDPADRKAVDVLLARPVGFDEAVAITKDFAAALAPPGARRALLDEIEAMLGEEGDRTGEERELLAHVRAVLQSHTPVDGLVDRLRGLFGRTLFARRPAEAGGGAKPGREAADERFLQAALDDHPARDADLQRLCADYCRVSTMDDRLHLLKVMFERAATDGTITKREAEHVRRVADLLWISRPEYFAVRDRYRERIEPLQA